MMDVNDRFFENVDKNGPTIVESRCWVWTRARNKDGYGYFRTETQTLAHRTSWELNNGVVAPGLFVLHRCDNPPCVNPAHLFEGTAADNMRDKMQKGRFYNGSDVITHCPRDHLYDEANTYVYRGKRHCRACHRASCERRRLRARAASS